jgi:ABC-type multidrug transport system fused ATPase/permease subunit
MIKKFFDHKIWTVLSACLAVLMLVFLAAGLGNVQFQPGLPLAKGEPTVIEVSVGKIAEAVANIPLWKIVVFWSLVFLLVIIFTALVPPEWRKKILKYFLRYTLFVLAIFYIVKNFRTLLPALNIDLARVSEGSVPAIGETAPPVFTPPNVPPALLYLVSLLVILVLAIVAFLTSRRWLHKQHLQKNSRPLVDLAEIAYSSLAEISSGKNWEDVIINCYARMSDVIYAQRGIHRRKDLTASEFAARLEEAGLPGEAVLRLTRLFETARYGARHASREEMIEAVACLTTVMCACGVNE